MRTMALVLLLLAACGGEDAPPAQARSFRMGFSAFPPSPDMARAEQSLQMWMERGDAAIFHDPPPWAALLAGGSPDSLAHVEFDPLVRVYRAHGLKVVVTIDATNPVDRTVENETLTAAGRSITEPEIQQLFRAWAVAVARVAEPDYLGLAAETNLIRYGSPRPVYDAVVTMTNAAAGEVRAVRPSQALYVSVQVDLAWGRLQGTGSYVGIATDLHDFPFITALGLSSYPYLAGFNEPSEVPDDWYARLGADASLPVFVAEGGWTSVSVPGVSSSPAKQARWIRRQAQLLARAQALFVFQLQFTDVDLAAFGLGDDPRVTPFARLGLVDTLLTPKPSLAAWDSVFALPLE